MFDARMYVSPLIDPKGQQTGWMTSMTNITEAKRIRDQLSASHERFTTVLEGLDASVSVLSVQQGELLFANRSYRLWFGADARGHTLLTGNQASAAFDATTDEDIDDLSGLPTQELTEGGADPREVYVEPLNKWFDVRSRYLQWTDGRLAQMLIATDVTARLKAEELAAQQAERAAGHEPADDHGRDGLVGGARAQPAADGDQQLLQRHGLSRECRRDRQGLDLVTALRKTAHQAERAGQIIHRIRNFVKKSEPQRRPRRRQIVEDAVELASIELRRRNVRSAPTWHSTCRCSWSTRS
jgi:hypothetical protein